MEVSQGVFVLLPPPPPPPPAQDQQQQQQPAEEPERGGQRRRRRKGTEDADPDSSPSGSSEIDSDRQLARWRRERLDADVASLDGLVLRHLVSLNEEIVSKIVRYVRNQAQAAKASTGKLSREVPTGLLCTGASMPDNDAFFETLASSVRAVQGHHVVVLMAGECGSLSSTIRAINKQLQQKEVDDIDMDDDDDEYTGGGRKGGLLKFESATKNRKRGKLSPFDWEMVRAWYRSQPQQDGPLVFILPDFHAFKSEVVSDLIAICSDATSPPVVLLFGITTTVSALREKLNGAALVRISTERFDLLPAATNLDRLLSQLLWHDRPSTGLRLASKAFSAMVDGFQTNHLSVRQCAMFLRYALIEHYCSNPLSIFTGPLCGGSLPSAASWQKITQYIGHDLVEQVRRLPSFKVYCESLYKKDHDKLRKLLLDDDYVLREAIPELMDQLGRSHQRSMVINKILLSLQNKLASDTFKRSDLFLYQSSLEGDLVDSPDVKSILRAATFISQPNMKELVTSWIGLLNANEMDEFATQLVRVAGDLGVAAAAIVQKKPADVAAPAPVRKTAAQPATTSQKRSAADVLAGPGASSSEQPAKRRRREEDEEIEEHDEVESAQEAIEEPRPVSQRDYKTIAQEIRLWLENLIRTAWPRYTAWPLHELVYFTRSAAITKALNPHPRGAIQFALTKPEHYLPEVAAEVPEPVPTSSRNKRKSAKKPVVARKAEADTVVLFRLYSECGRLINLHDLFVAFEAAVTDEGAPNPPAAAELRGRFLRGMAELQWLGFVKPTSAKTDHVIRLTWGSLASN